MRRLGIGAVCIACLCAQAPAEGVSVTEQSKLYDVEGKDAHELRANLDAQGPEDEHGRHDALTKWYVKWHYDYDRGDRCRLKNIRVTLDIKRTMPRWVAETPELVERWHRYLDALKTHEDGHAKNGHDCARAILARLQALAPQADCDRAEELANAQGNAELDTARQRDASYDAETHHGRTQGATFR